ncbi:hypothetical protein IX51_01465 [uncultured archaeon]|nr:hypothetical protein IX51_01465 [uncultured archaeon]HKJ96800.1 hypothetical protein [Thermoplasmataceae archaeon]
MTPWNPWNWEIFLLVVLALLALSLIILGILTSYFGSGKSRAVGIVLLIVGIVVGLVTVLGSEYYWHAGFVQNVVVATIYYVIAAIIGAAIGLLVFLGAIMKT